jgi:GNAT superfamily N-acetyltransferase
MPAQIREGKCANRKARSRHLLGTKSKSVRSCWLGQRDPNELRAAFARSSFKAFAFEGGELIGFGRTIDDGRYAATVVDVVVSPVHQRRGVGRAILEHVHSQLKGFLIVTLTAAPDVLSIADWVGANRRRR